MYELFILSVCAAFPVHLIPFNLIAVVILDEDYKLLSVVCLSALA